MARADGEVLIVAKIDDKGISTGVRQIQLGTKQVEIAVKSMADSVTNATQRQSDQMNKLVGQFVQQNQAYTNQKAKVEELKEVYGELQNYEENIARIQRELASAKSQLGKGGLSLDDYMKTEQKIKDLQEDLKATTDAKKNLFGSKTTDQLGAQIQTEEGKLDQLGSKALDTSGKLERMAQGFKNENMNARLEDTKQRMISLAQTATTKLAGALSSAGKLFMGLRSRIKGSNQGMDGLNNAFKKSLKMVLKYGLGIRSFFILWRKIRTAITEGIKTLAKQDSELNKSMSMMSNSVKTLKNATALAVAPIVNALAPAISYLIDRLTAGISVIGQFTAALTGASTYKAATKVNEDYAKSMDKTASSTKKANKEQSKYLSGLDDMKIYSTNKNNDDSGTAISFDTKPIDNKIKSFAKKLKKLIKEGDFEGVGELIAKQLDNGLKRIDWNKIKARARKIGTTLARILNGFFNYKGLATTLGTSIAEALNTALNFAVSFLSTFDFVNFGSWLATGLNGFVEKFDWTRLGQYIGGKIEGAIDTAWGFVTTYNWGSVGKGLSTTLNNIFSSINWVRLAQTINTGIVGIADELVSFLEGVDWKTIGSDIGDFLMNLDYDKIVSKISKALGTAIGSASQIVNGLGEKYLDKMIDGIKKQAKNYEKNGNPRFVAISKAIAKAILKSISFPENWIYDYVVDPLLTGIITSATGIDENSAIIKNLRNAFKKIFKHIFSAINPILGLKSLVTNVKDLIKALAKGKDVKVAQFKVDYSQVQYVPGGSTNWGPSIVPKSSSKSMPALAKGAVIPPNREFTAILGDQRYGNNLEAPEGLIRQIVREETGNGGGVYNFSATINRRVLFEEMIEEARLQRRATGINKFATL